MQQQFDPAEYQIWMKRFRVAISDLTAATGLHSNTIRRCLIGGGNPSTKVALMKARPELEFPAPVQAG